MRYEDYEDSANDEYDIGYCLSPTARQRKQASDDYELLENYEFISHLESSGLLKEYREASCKRESTEDIHIDLNFMEDPSFYHEVEYFDKLNTTLEKELIELDGKLTTPPSARKLAKIHNKNRMWKIQIFFVVCCLLAIVFLLGGDYLTSGLVDSEGDVYALDIKEKVTDNTNPNLDSVQSDVSEVVYNTKNEEMKTQSSLSTNHNQGVSNIQEEKTIESAAEKNVKKEQSEQQFLDTAFIGNSLVVGLKQTCNVSGASFFACQSLDINGAFQKAFVYDKENGGKLTILQALSKKQFKRIYLMFGINELGWPYSSVFVDKYQEFIRQIKVLQPKAEVYVQSILPVTKSCSAKRPIFTKKNVMDRNKLLKKMCTDLDIVYLNVYSALCDEKGYLPEANSTDGIHLRKDSYKIWLDYIQDQIKEE